MTEKDIFSMVQDIISEQFAVSPQLVQPDTNLVQTFNFDSLDRVETFMLIENRLGRPLSEQEEILLETNFNTNPTPQTIIDFFCKKLKIMQPSKNPLYKKSVPELVAIIERQRAELSRLRIQNKR